MNVIHNAYTAWVILLLSLIVTICAWYISSKLANERAQDRFMFRVQEMTHAIEERMSIYEQALWGGVALFYASTEVTREDWREYVRVLELDQNWKGIQGMGYAIPLKPEHLKDHEKAIQDEGFPDYHVKPNHTRDEYSAIIYLEPFDWRNKRAFGYDMWSNEMRRIAMKRAMETGDASISGMITLVQETDKDVQRGFLMYLPYYDGVKKYDSLDDRLKYFKGWVYAAFRVGDLMHGILGESSNELSFEIYDGDKIEKESLLYDSNEDKGDQVSQEIIFVEEVRLELQGRPWNVLFQSADTYLSDDEAGLPTWIAIGGFTIDILLFYVIFALSTLQRRAENIATEKTKELRDQTENLKRSNHELERFAYIASHDLKSPLRAIDNLSLWIIEDSDKDLNPESKENLQEIRKRIKRMQTLIEGLLEFSKVDRKNHGVESVDCRVLVDEILGLQEMTSRFEIKIQGELPVFEARKQLLIIVFTNLISNVFKHHDKVGNGAWLEIKCNESESHYVFSISDNGPGIPKELHQKAFQMFQTLKPRDEVEGSGLGLAMVKKIVELEGGEITLESDTGKGCKFTFSWPKELYCG